MFPLNGRALWLTQDGECARGGELLQRSHLGGMHVAPKYASIGPSDPLNIVFTHNVGKTNQEAQYPEYVRVYDATDEMLLASGTLAVCDALVVLSEYHKIELVDKTWPCERWSGGVKSSTGCGGRKTRNPCGRTRTGS